MNDRFRVSTSLAERLRSHGIAPAAVLLRSGLPPGFFQQEKIYLSTAQLFAFWRAVGESSPDPVIGLKLGAEQRLEHYNPTAIATVCSRTFRDAVQRIARYKQLTCPEEIRIHLTTDEAAVEFVFIAADQHAPDVLVDMCLSWMLAIGRRVTDGQIAPRRVELMRPAQHADQLERHFGCRVRFKATGDALILSRQDFERTFVTHNQELLSTIGAHLEAELRALDATDDVHGQVKRALKRSMAGKRPALQLVAQELGMSERTLQRRLTVAGSSFQRIAEDARRELAHHYLRRSAIDVHEIAYLLGYEDANSFFRAFHQWEGAAPGEWRARHEDPAAVNA
jgi:AraC-like DNA-binding protein